MLRSLFGPPRKRLRVDATLQGEPYLPAPGSQRMMLFRPNGGIHGPRAPRGKKQPLLDIYVPLERAGELVPVKVAAAPGSAFRSHRESVEDRAHPLVVLMEAVREPLPLAGREGHENLRCTGCASGVGSAWRFRRYGASSVRSAFPCIVCMSPRRGSTRRANNRGARSVRTERRFCRTSGLRRQEGGWETVMNVTRSARQMAPGRCLPRTLCVGGSRVASPPGQRHATEDQGACIVT